MGDIDIIQEETVAYPWVTFKILQRAYCVSSRYINAIIVPTEILAVPESPLTTMGVITLYGQAIEIIDLRVLFQMPPLSEDLADFAKMKELHLEWVEELEASVRENKEFYLAKDPHKCKFGMWFDQFSTENHSLKHVLNRIEEPHKQLHRCAIELEKYRGVSNEKMIEDTLEKATDLCHNHIVPLLDKLIATYAEVNRGIIIVLEMEGSKIGIFADQVTGTKVFEKSDFKLEKSSQLKFSSYIKNIISPPNAPIYMELDVNTIMTLKNPEQNTFDPQEDIFCEIE